MIITWETGFGKYNWMLIKNIICIIFGLFALVFGSKHAVEEIISTFFATEEQQQGI